TMMTTTTRTTTIPFPAQPIGILEPPSVPITTVTIVSGMALFLVVSVIVFLVARSFYKRHKKTSANKSKGANEATRRLNTTNKQHKDVELGAGRAAERAERADSRPPMSSLPPPPPRSPPPHPLYQTFKLLQQ